MYMFGGFLTRSTNLLFMYECMCVVVFFIFFSLYHVALCIRSLLLSFSNSFRHLHTFVTGLLNVCYSFFFFGGRGML